MIGEVIATDSRIIIEADEPKKSTIVAVILFFPLCLVDWIFVWVGMAEPDEPKTASFFIFLCWLVIIAGVVAESNVRYKIDRNGVTRIFFKRFVTFLPWSDMRYIGTRSRSVIFGKWTHTNMIFSTVPFSEYINDGSLRILKKAICVRYIGDDLYDQVLDFCGGERDF